MSGVCSHGYAVVRIRIAQLLDAFQKDLHVYE